MWRKFNLYERLGMIFGMILGYGVLLMLSCGLATGNEEHTVS